MSSDSTTVAGSFPSHDTTVESLGTAAAAAAASYGRISFNHSEMGSGLPPSTPPSTSSTDSSFPPGENVTVIEVGEKAKRRA